jgi:hypothetical protein
MRFGYDMLETRSDDNREVKESEPIPGLPDLRPSKEEIMFQSSMRRPFLVFALALVLGSTAGQATAPTWSFGELGRAAWSLVLRGEWWRGTLGASAKHGCTIDPDGANRCDPTPKLGCTIDPNGATRCEPAPKLGCTIDPNGSPRCTP